MGGVDIFFDYVCPGIGVVMATSICAGTYVRVGFRVLGGSTILWTTTTTAIVGLLSFPCETAIISSLSLIHLWIRSVLFGLASFG